ncbi:molybdopterin-guanine dinucleotide biosynthesis protein MobA [Sulfuricaulis limicola]|uniref:Molybdopterin-guanine dinucleotide biosynthesis protein MobA n=1 Tax=Sulfuricaulis limicola TaxID=1620215 RepID=A0A1B4XG08_9GAMM|nr:nucleotidyltransferase family protein [Sulfuricaulis limicola]BAV33723.1 molybdopterin-guanine dinucleotide biosynthesis protein MobA [Sulfuricaulis limicola]
MPGPGPRIVGVLLAAGSGTRFGGHKLLAPLPDGTTVAVAAARHLIDALPDSVAVLRPGDETLAALLAAEGLRIVVNPNADAGMGASLACGVSAVEADGWVIALADMPAIRLATIQAVAEALATGASLAAPVYHGQRGHPIGFARGFRAALTALTGDRGGRDILAQHSDEVRLIETDDPGVLVDIDHAADIVAGER